MDKNPSGAVAPDAPDKTADKVKSPVAGASVQNLSPDQMRAKLATLESELERERGRARLTRRTLQAMLIELVHEIKTPLNAASGLATVMEQELLGPIGNDRYRKQASLIHQALGTIDGICERVMREVNPESEPADKLAQIATVDAREVLENLVGVFSGVALEKGVTLKTDVEEGFPQIRTDPVKLTQVLNNIISNAITHSARGGSVLIRAETDMESNAVFLVIKDDGPGVTADRLLSLARIYERIPENAVQSQRGVGLGLPISQRLMQEMGGELRLRSQSGVGTVVTLEFPASMIVR